MARVRGRINRGRPPVVEPSYSFRSMTLLVGGFCAMIGIVLGVSYGSRTASTVGANMNGNTKSAMTTTKNRFSSPDEIPKSVVDSLDAILVLGGGAPEAWNRPPAYVRRRCDDAVTVRRQTNHNKPPILCLSAGTAHVPQLLHPQTGLPIWESTASAAYLQTQYPDDFAKTNSIPDLYVETTSYDTIGNAFYARTSHTDLAGWRNLLIITNEFHMNRSQAIFDWIFGLPPPPNSNKSASHKKSSRKTSSSSNSSPYRLYYLDSPNVGLSASALQVRIHKEASSLDTVETQYRTQIDSLAGVWQMLTAQHGLYTAGQLIQRAQADISKDEAGNSNEELKLSYGGK